MEGTGLGKYDGYGIGKDEGWLYKETFDGGDDINTA